MTDSFTGRVAAVNTLPLGSTLALAISAGATTLVVEDSADFDEDGGTVLLGGTEVLTYTSADDGAGEIYLAAPAASAWEIDTRVEVWDPETGTRVSETYAEVLVEGAEQAGDSLVATVDHALIPYLPEGMRVAAPGSGTIGEAVALAWRGEELVVVNVLGRTPVMDGSVIDPETLPPSGAEPAEPVSPTAPVVVGGIASLLVRWAPIVHPNPVTYELHVSPTTPVVPSASTLVGEVTGSQLTVRRLPIPNTELGTPDSPLVYGATYYAVVIAKDSIDPTFESAPSAEGAGSPVQATAGDLAADSVTTESLVAGSVNGEILAGELLLGSRIATAEAGQRVEMDPSGFRLYNASEELRVELPTDPARDPAFRGRVEADGLTVRQGASFYSTLNEFAKDSRISLAEQVTAPVAAPQVGSFWESVTQDTTPRAGSLGTFGFDAALISSASYIPSWNAFAFVQRVPSGGARVWYMNLNGTFNALWDMPSDWHVTSAAVGSDGEWRIMLRFEGNGEWYIYDYTQTNKYRKYTRQNTSREPQLTMDGNNVWVVESFSTGPRFYRVDPSTPIGGSTIVETINGSGTPVGGIITNSPWTFMRTAADFGSPRFIVSYNGTSTFRVYNTSGVHQPAETWSPPAAKSTGWWDPVASRFRTLGLDNRAYRHSAMTWTDSALDTWHLAQTFYDSQATGGTHETLIGGIRTFQPLKRSWVRITPAQVPYTGGTDDPNNSRIYGKTGAAPPAIGTGMYLQETVNYTSPIRDRAALLVTSGTTPPATSNFPGANPARLVSARAMPSDGTKPIVDIRGDGSGRWGPLEFDGNGKFSTSYDTGWVALVVASGFTADPSDPPMVRRIGDQVAYKGRANPNSSMSGSFTPFTIPPGAGAIPATSRYCTTYVASGTYARLQASPGGTVAVNNFPTGTGNIDLSPLTYML